MKLLVVLFSLLLILALVDCQQQQNFRRMRQRQGMRRQPLNRAGGFTGNNNNVGPVGPPRQPVPLRNANNDGMPGLRPPKGVAEQLNRAKLKDFMQLGQVLMQRRRLHA
uniref:Uncharacterized protein n=1 Tax=Panagrellus redivivus TaxID=6233 RepID=A0A7E4WCI9_PANRE